MVRADKISNTTPVVNLDWIRNPFPLTFTPYQRHIRDVDWSKTALGPMTSWCQELRHTVRFLMGEADPTILYWGTDCLIIYNEAYIPLIGGRSPCRQGTKASSAFPDSWSHLDSVIKEQRSGGHVYREDTKMVMVDRGKSLEETYFRWTLNPIADDNGTILGSYGRATTASADVIDSRRSRCTQKLAQHLAGVTSLSEIWDRSMEALSDNDKDIPLAMLYSIHQDTMNRFGGESVVCSLQALLGVSETHECAEASLDLQHATAGLAPLMLAAFNKCSLHIVSLKEAGLDNFFDGVEWRGFGIPVQELAILPIKTHNVTEAILVVGLNPRLQFTDEYRNFINLIGDILSPHISRLRFDAGIVPQNQVAKVASLNVQNSKDIFLQITEQSPFGLILADKDGKVLYANNTWYQSCGLERDEHTLLSWFDTVLEDDLPKFNAKWHHVINFQESATFQIRSKISYVNGEMTSKHRTWSVAIHPNLDENANITNLMGFITDISELKWNKEQLHLRQKEVAVSETRYRRFAENAPIGVVRTDKEGYIQFANEAWRSFYSFAKDHKFTEPQPWLSSLHTADVPLATQFFDDVCSNPQPRSVEVRMNRCKIGPEDHLTTPSEIWLLASGFRELNVDGSVNSVHFWVTDITDQKAVEKILTNKMEEAIRLKNTQERFLDMISHEIRNPLSAILHCGEEIVDAMKNCLNSTASSLPSPTITENELPTSRSTTVSDVNNALDAANIILYCAQHQKQIVDDVLTLSRLDADLLVVSPVPVQPTELTKTALKIFEPELKSSGIELHLETGPSLQDLNTNWIMLDSKRYLQVVINLVTNAIKFTRNSTTKRIMIHMDVSDQKPSQQQSGVHYVPRRVPNDDVDENEARDGFDQPLEEDLYLCFSVADTGKGLTEAERMNLFNRFTQASPKTHIEYGGSGLGLFISRQITEMLGGEIGVGSEPGKGATFAFYVPSRQVNPPRRASIDIRPISVYSEASKSDTPGERVADLRRNRATKVEETPIHELTLNPRSTSQNYRVLVVEDNLINQKVLCKQLRKRDFIVEAANHGREALDTVKSAHSEESHSYFDVILCDIEMPIMDGIECVTELRRLEREGILSGRIPIIGVTANVSSQQISAAIEAGMDGVTTKPYRIDDLIAHIVRVCVDVKPSV